RGARARLIATDLTRVRPALILPLRAKVAELVDAQGSGPCSPYRLWGFESPLSHQSKPLDPTESTVYVGMAGVSCLPRRWFLSPNRSKTGPRRAVWGRNG